MNNDFENQMNNDFENQMNNKKDGIQQNINQLKK